MKKVIALFIYSLGGGGAEKAVIELAHALKTDYDVHIVTMSDVVKYDVKDIPVTSLARHDLHTSAFKKALSILKIIAAFVAFCRKNRVSCIVSYLARPNIIAVLSSFFLRNVRVICTEHSTLSHYYKHSIVERVLLRLLRFAYSHADKVIAVSLGIKKDLVRFLGVEGTHIDVVYNIIDIERIRESARLNPPNRTRFTFVSAGRFVESKNFPFLLRAFAMAGNECDLWILGAGDEEETGMLRLLAVELGIHERVTFWGFQQNPYRFFSVSDCFVMASKLEGLPTVLIEALACGCPVISTDCKSGPREILGGEGDELISGLEKAPYGILASLDNPKFLALAMRKMQEDSRMRNEYRIASSEAIARFLPDETVKKYKHTIDGL